VPWFKLLSTTEHSKQLRGLQSSSRSNVDFFRYSQTGLDRARQAWCYHLHCIPGYCMLNEQRNSTPDICTKWVGQHWNSLAQHHYLAYTTDIDFPFKEEETGEISISSTATSRNFQLPMQRSLLSLLCKSYRKQKSFC